eukprot:6473090-Amphidinium_carterae.1
MTDDRVIKLKQLIDLGSRACEQNIARRCLKIIHRHCCVLWQYTADNTPIRARTWETLRAGSGARRASAKVTEEYFSQALFCSIETGDGEACHASILTPPTILLHGKTMRALYTLAAEMPGLSLIGESSSIEVFHQIHDRAMVQSFREAVSGRVLEGKGETELQTTAGETRSVQSLRLWCTSVGRAAHDLHNSLKWGSHAVYGEAITKEHLKSFY